jgi:hypothetical protein
VELKEGAEWAEWVRQSLEKYREDRRLMGDNPLHCSWTMCLLVGTAKRYTCSGSTM